MQIITWFWTSIISPVFTALAAAWTFVASHGITAIAIGAAVVIVAAIAHRLTR